MSASSNPLTSASSESNDVNLQYAPQNTSINFVQHKRFDDALINPDRMIKPRMPTGKLARPEDHQPVVGGAPKHELLVQAQTQPSTSSQGPAHKHKRHDGPLKKSGKRSSAVSTNASTATGTERATDDYCLERFRKNMRFSRTSKIKIA